MRFLTGWAFFSGVDLDKGNLNKIAIALLWTHRGFTSTILSPNPTHTLKCIAKTASVFASARVMIAHYEFIFADEPRINGTRVWCQVFISLSSLNKKSTQLLADIFSEMREFLAENTNTFFLSIARYADVPYFIDKWRDVMWSGRWTDSL